MSPGLWALILLASVVLCIDTFIIVEVDILAILFLLFLLLCLVAGVLCIRELADVIGLILVVGISKLQVVLLSMHSSLLVGLSIHYFL